VPMVPLVALLGIGMHAAWKRARLTAVKRPLGVALLVALVLAGLWTWFAYGRTTLLAVIGGALGLWVIYSALREPLSRLRHGHSLSAAVLGMAIAHFGVGMFVVGVTMVEGFKIEKDVALRPGQSGMVGDYQLTFVDAREVQGPNYSAVEAHIAVSRDGQPVTQLRSQKRTYRVQTSPMTEAGIEVGWTRDLFVALGDDLGDGAWSMHVRYKPMIRYIWLGAFLMALGGLLAASDRRYRRERATEPATGAITARSSA
jgi:cytochrome c-type biogenesis protein CcmF